MWSEQSGDHSHDESHELGHDDEERSNEEEKEIPLFEQLVDPSVLEPEPQAARSPLASRLAALTIHGIVDTDRPVGCSLSLRRTKHSKALTSRTWIRQN